jgi:hypothetical protein
MKEELFDELRFYAIDIDHNWDEIFYNKYTDTKPSDISNQDHRLLAVICLMANHAAWLKTTPKELVYDYCNIYQDIRDFFYESEQVDKKDTYTFHRLID